VNRCNDGQRDNIDDETVDNESNHINDEAAGQRNRIEADC
jgi:hypothetical protein